MVVPLQQISGMSKKSLLYLGFFAALAVGFYYLVVSLVPEFNAKEFPPISSVRPFAFTNQDGKVVTNNDVKGKVQAVEYFFTTCQGICPIMNNNMKLVYEELKDEPDFLILSHTCQPEVDSVPRMKRYADSLQVNTAKWIFLTGRKDSLYNMARLSYTIDDNQNPLANIEDDFIHSQFFALVDKEGNVRKIYDGLKKSEVKKLIADAKKLLKP